MVKVIGELIEGIAGRAGLKNVREVGERLTKSDRQPSRGGAGEPAEKLLDAVGSDLLDFGQMIITGMKDTTGQGDPDTGERFGRAQSAFDGVNAALKAAVPTGWDGSGSDAYADQNTRQQLRSAAMATVDHEVHKVLFREAAQITLRRGYLDDQCKFLTATSDVTFPLQFIPRYGEAMKLAFEMHAVLAALEEGHFQMTQLQSEVAQNAAELKQAVGRYSGVADGAELSDATSYFDQPPPPSSGARLPAAEPSVQPQQIVAPSAVPRLPAPAGGVEAAPAVTSGPTVTPAETKPPVPSPVAEGLPPLPQVPPVSPLGGLSTGAAPAPGPLAAPPAPRHNKKARHRDDEPAPGEDESEDEGPERAAPCDGEAGRMPLAAEVNPEPADHHEPFAARSEPSNPPGSPAGTPPQGNR